MGKYFLYAEGLRYEHEVPEYVTTESLGSRLLNHPPFWLEVKRFGEVHLVRSDTVTSYQDANQSVAF